MKKKNGNARSAAILWVFDGPSRPLRAINLEFCFHPQYAFVAVTSIASIYSNIQMHTVNTMVSQTEEAIKLK